MVMLAYSVRDQFEDSRQDSLQQQQLAACSGVLPSLEPEGLVG